MSIVVLEYEDLVSDKDLSEQILKAYGAGSVGALGVRGIPNWAEMRDKTLPLSHKLSHLSDEKLQALEDETSMYNAGWSLGKEKMGDKPDFGKGSFYYNPLQDDPSPELRSEFPWALPANKWPDEADIPKFRDNCREIGSVMRDVAVLLARHIDKAIAANVPGYKKGLLHEAMSNSVKAKARMLYYYPIKVSAEAPAAVATDNWIAWHNDSGFLTTLAGEIYVNHDTGAIVPNPEPDTAGLYISDREGNETKITIPGDCLGIQLGECTQVISGGLLVATPHCVRGCTRTPNIARISLPCFVDTYPTFPLSMPAGCTRDDVFRNTVDQKVPPLAGRWLQDGVTFAQFLGDSFKSYYEWTTKK